jgi:HPt (histidine-containing phosphotransfer) domain-containing protein
MVRRMNPDFQAFDFSILNGWYAAKPDKAATFVELTLKDSARIYTEIAQAVTAGNMADLTESAHALKSVAGQIGGHELSGLCRELEIIGGNGCLDDAAATFDHVQAAYRAFVDSIKSVAAQGT